MDKEKKESAKQAAENFVKKSEIEKAFILGLSLQLQDECPWLYGQADAA